MTRTVIAPSVCLGEEHHMQLWLPIAAHKKGGRSSNDEALDAVLHAHSLAHRCAVDRSATKGDTSVIHCSRDFLKHQVAISPEQTTHQERNKTQKTQGALSAIIRNNPQIKV